MRKTKHILVPSDGGDGSGEMLEGDIERGEYDIDCDFVSSRASDLRHSERLKSQGETTIPSVWLRNIDPTEVTVGVWPDLSVQFGAKVIR